ncbi:MAG TPA: DoxX family protein [Saprospiraceae bacterium]|nr:DoxX family protein [Saprospiraceae bacterium]
MYHLLDLIGRIMMSAIFVFEAIDSIMYAEQTKKTMADYGILWRQDLLLYGSITILIVGALMLLIGYRVKLGAWLLLIYWIPVTCLVYSFWNDPVETQRLNAIFFMRNIAIAGGLLIIASNGAGKYSIKRIMQVSKIPARET